MSAGVVLYDGHCRICRAGSTRLQRLARPGAIEVRDFQAPGVLADFPQLRYEDCMRAMQLVTAEGRVYEGAEAVARLLMTRPIAGVLGRLYYAPGVRQIADAVYRWVARNRYRWTGRDACEDGACAVHVGRPPTDQRG